MDNLGRLWDCRQILAGDYLAGRQYQMLWRHRRTAFSAAALKNADAALNGAGVRARAAIIEIVELGRMPRSRQGLAALLTALDTLNRHFRRTGQLTGSFDHRQ